MDSGRRRLGRLVGRAPIGALAFDRLERLYSTGLMNGSNSVVVDLSPRTRSTGAPASAGRHLASRRPQSVSN